MPRDLLFDNEDISQDSQCGPRSGSSQSGGVGPTGTIEWTAQISNRVGSYYSSHYLRKSGRTFLSAKRVSIRRACCTFGVGCKSSTTRSAGTCRRNYAFGDEYNRGLVDRKFCFSAGSVRLAPAS